MNTFSHLIEADTQNFSLIDWNIFMRKLLSTDIILVLMDS